MLASSPAQLAATVHLARRRFPFNSIVISSSTVQQQRSSRAAYCAAAAGNEPSASPDSYRIAVPSYDRAQTVQQRTLAALDAAGVDTSSRVDIFVTNKQEADKYNKVLTPGTYASIVIGTSGIGKQRDFILKHYGPGANIVMMDDDIQWFVQLYEGPVDVHRTILKGFELSQQHGCYMWGLNNSSNKFYLKPTYSVGWCFFQGPFMAFRVRDSVHLHPEFHTTRKDVQYSLMHCEMDGKLLRLNGIGLKARPYGKEPGGLQTTMDMFQRQQSDEENREYLVRRYGDYIRSWPDNKPHPAVKRSREHKVYPLQL